MKGTLIDIHQYGAHLAVWVREGDKTKMYLARHMGWFLIQTEDSERDLKRLTDLGYDVCHQLKKDIESDGVGDAIKLTVKDNRRMRKDVEDVERLGSYRWVLFNADITAEQSFMFENDLAPLCEISYEVNGQWMTKVEKTGRYILPDLRQMRLEFSSSYSPQKDYNCTLTEIRANEKVFTGGEKEILDGFRRFYEGFDAEVIICQEGDSFGIDYLLERFKKNNIPFFFGRLFQDFQKRNGKSFFSYGSIIRRNPSHYLHGRVHIDSSSFMYREGGLSGVCELANMCMMPIQKTARLSPGAAITNLYTARSYQAGYAIAYKQNMVEDFKTARLLLEADKGGFIYEPKVGLHTDVCELDFASLYPHIMVNYNISPETVLCSCCRGKNLVPYAGYNVCEKRVGLVPKVLKPILMRRQELKSEYAKTSEDRFRGGANCLKWVLVTSFGYMGYRKSRFGRIEAHEAITSWARHILLETTAIAEDMGFEVLHGLVDSLWVKKKGLNADDIEKLQREVFRRFSIPFEVEGFYRWIVFLPSVSSPIAPVPNRYYGVFTDGEAKVRGIELRRRDAPNMVKEFQREVIKHLSEASDISSFKELIPGCTHILARYKARIYGGEFMLEDLAIRKRISKEVGDYRASCSQSVVLKHLEDAGIERNPGDKIEYVIRDSQAKEASKRYSPIECPKDLKVDCGKYLELCARALESMLCVFGKSHKEILDLLRHGVQTRITQYMDVF